MSQTLLRRRAVILDELRQIMGAMRNMSVMALQQLGKAVEVEQEARYVVLQALTDIDAILPPLNGTEICLAIGSERGFCGGFNDRVAECLRVYRAQHPAARCYVAGARLLPLLDPDNITPVTGCTDMEEAADVVGDWLGLLLPDAQTLAPITVIHQDDAGVRANTLLPLPELPAKSVTVSPWRYLPDPALTAGLISEWLRLALLSALTQSLTLEHRWRLNQMERADHYLEETGTTLRGTLQRQRQNQITVELENLMNALDMQERVF